MVQLLLDRGVEPNTADHWGTTALHCASYKSHNSVVQLLLHKGADPNIEDQLQATPLSWTLANRHNDIAKTLHANGAKCLNIGETQTLECITQGVTPSPIYPYLSNRREMYTWNHR